MQRRGTRSKIVLTLSGAVMQSQEVHDISVALPAGNLSEAALPALREAFARAYAAPGEPAEPTLPSNIEPKVSGSRLSSDSITDPDPRENPAAGEGTLVIEAPSGVYFQIDHRGWQTVQPAPLRLRSGPHTVVSLAETLEILISDGTTTTVKIRESEVEQFLQAGLTAKRKDNLRAAQRQLAGAHELPRLRCERGDRHVEGRHEALRHVDARRDGEQRQARGDRKDQRAHESRHGHSQPHRDPLPPRVMRNRDTRLPVSPVTRRS